MSSDPPIWRGTRPSHGITRVQAYSLRSLKKGECGPLSTGPAGRELKRDGSMVACKGYSPKHKKRRLAEASALKEGGGITPQTVNLRVCPPARPAPRSPQPATPLRQSPTAWRPPRASYRPSSIVVHASPYPNATSPYRPA